MAQNNRVSISVAAFGGVNVVCGYSHSPMKGCALPYPELRLSIVLGTLLQNGLSQGYVKKRELEFSDLL